MEPSTFVHIALLCAALSSETRLDIVDTLRRGEKTAAELAAALRLPQTALSADLAALTHAGVLSVRRRGTMRCYSLSGALLPHALTLLESRHRASRLYHAPATVEA